MTNHNTCAILIHVEICLLLKRPKEVSQFETYFFNFSCYGHCNYGHPVNGNGSIC